MMGAIRRAITIAALLSSACGTPQVDRCQVRCEASGPCPGDHVCGADLFCHAADDTALCGDSDGGTLVDAAPCADEGSACDDGRVCFEGICGGGEVIDVDEGCAVTRSGSAYCWGADEWGRAGVAVPNADLCSDDTPCVYRPTRVDGVAGLTDISTARDAVACGIDGDGAVWCWGLNDVGQLGHDPSDDTASCSGLACTSVPARVEGIPDATLVAAGRHVTCSGDGSHTVHCWGSNDTQIMGPAAPAGTTPPTAIDLPGPVMDLAVGSSSGGPFAFVCALVAELDQPRPTIFCWGSNRNGELGHDPALDDSCDNGICSPMPTRVEIDGGEPVPADEIDAGDEEVVCLRRADTVECWGYGGYGMVGPDAVASNTFVPTVISGVTADSISVGATHACAVTQEGGVACWGVNAEGELGIGTTSGDGTSDCLSAAPCHVEAVAAMGPPGASQVAAGLGATVALDGDGSLWTWGWNGFANLAHEPGAGDDIACNQFACDPTPREVSFP